MKTITISRQYGSGGRYIAALLSEKMGVPCYDSKLLLKEAERHGISQEIINEFKGKTSLLYAIGVMMSEESQDKKRLTIPEKMFHAQKETVKRLAQEGPCIFVGRCADQILKDDRESQTPHAAIKAFAAVEVRKHIVLPRGNSLFCNRTQPFIERIHLFVGIVWREGNAQHSGQYAFGKAHGGKDMAGLAPMAG